MNFPKFRHVAPAASIILAFATAHAEQAQSAFPFSSDERTNVIQSLATDIEQRFVFPDVALRYATALRQNLAAGRYDDQTDPDAFAKKVTADLQAVASDGHLRLRIARQFRPMPAGAPAPAGARPAPLDVTKMIGNVAYLHFNNFPNDAATAKQARDFLLAHADASAVIIDSRDNHGGTVDVMDAILPLLYANKTTLVRMDTRVIPPSEAPDAQEEMPTPASFVPQPSPAGIDRHDHVVTPDPTEKRLQAVPVYYLISNETFSAAEHLALAFKRTHRALLIGETTGGGGHFGMEVPEGEHFAAFIPFGRTYDPVTGWDWEGTGVSPDVRVSSDHALDEALRRATGKS